MNSIRFYLSLFLICIFTVSLAQDDRTNINYQNAIMLTVQNGSCSTGNYVDLNSLSTNYGDRTSSCVSDSPTTDYISLWYKATVPSSGKLTIETFGPEGYSAGSSSVLVAYTLSGTTLTEIGCGAYQAGVGDFTIIELTNQTIGAVIYIMATDKSTIGGVVDPSLSPYNICAYNPDSLGAPEIDKPLLSYYSNPVGNRLRLESPYQIQSLTIHDLAGGEVLTKSPLKQKLWLNTYSLSSGVYLLNVQTAEGEQTVKLVKK
jgi:hypothetical protein